MILEISATAGVAKMRAQAYVACIPSNQLVKPVPVGVNSRGRYKLLAQVEGPESSSAEGLAAQVEDPL